MHKLAWVLQIVFGAYFVASGVMHFVVPEGLPEPMAWMYELPMWLHYASGTAEILGGLGLVLPGLTRIKTGLTPLAAGGLAAVMLLAAAWHLPRGETQSIATNLVVAAVMALLAYVRWRTHPLPARQ